MRRLPGVLGILTLATVGLYCASVNVYVSWPSPETLGEAADAIVEDVRPELPSPATSSSDKSGRTGGLTGVRGRVLLASWPDSAGAGPSPTVILTGGELEVTTATIRRIKESLLKRFPQLLPHYQAGRTGESNLGLLELLGTGGLSLKERAELQKLIKAENEDRMTLYREFLRANKFDPEKLSEVQKAFAESWQKKAQPGWYIQDEKGRWLKKPRPKQEAEPVAKAVADGSTS